MCVEQNSTTSRDPGRVWRSQWDQTVKWHQYTKQISSNKFKFCMIVKHLDHAHAATFDLASTES